MKLALHNYWRSSASYRVRIALALKQLDYAYLVVDIVRGGAAGGGSQHEDAYRAKNPMGQVPTLEIVEDDGRVHHLFQSLPIIEYLDERWPEPAPLLPRRDLELRATARALAEMINSGIQPLQNLSTTKAVTALGGDQQAWVGQFVGAGLAALEQAVAATAGRFCVGDQPGVVDCLLVPQMFAARRFGVDLDRCPRLVAIDAACAELPAFAAAHPDRQPDAHGRG